MLFPNGAEIAASTATTSAAFADLVRRGEAIRIARGLYARAIAEQLDEVVRRNRYQVLALVAPGAVISDRSAFCMDHVAGDVLFACHDAPARDIELPGLRIRLRIGQPALTTDQLLPMGAPPIAIASAARSILENTAPSRARSGPARTLAPDELEQQLVGWTQTRGAAFVIEALTSSVHLAKSPGFDVFERGVSHLEEIRNALQGGRRDGARSKALRAVASGTPFDVKRIERFQTLLTALSQYDHAPKQGHGEESDALPFFEAYFSNFIEGTEFAVEEAERIVFEGALPAGRTQDAHDVRCTYTLTHDHDEMATTPTQAADLIKLATTRHRIMMASRPDKRPGKFKLERNQAGATAFVHPDLVRGTLLHGFEMAQQVQLPFQRAVFMLFLISEVHPFDDGNGRISRLMMNAELVAGREQRVIVPIAARGTYLAALRALTRNDNPDPLIDCLEMLQSRTHDIDWTDRTTARTSLEAVGAFEDPDIAPSEWRLI